MITRQEYDRAADTQGTTPFRPAALMDDKRAPMVENQAVRNKLCARGAWRAILLSFYRTVRVPVRPVWKHVIYIFGWAWVPGMEALVPDTTRTHFESSSPAT